MTQSVWWIPEVDYRISTGVIFFMILLLWARGEARPRLGLRCALSFLVLCGTSWLVRYGTDRLAATPALNALGYSMLILTMCVAFIACHALCYRAGASEYVDCVILAVTVYRLAWNVLKALTAAQWLLGLEFPWAGDSLANSLGSYCIYFGVVLICYIPFGVEKRADELLSLSMFGGWAAFVLICHMALEFLYRYFAENSAYSFMLNGADGAAFSLMFYFSSLLYCVISYAAMLLRVYANQLERDKADMQRFIHDKQEYYRINRGGIASLQQKCHDLKHQIALIRSAEGKRQFDEYVRGLEDTINEYNTVIETGNESIDVVLTEKNIHCSIKGIKFTYMIDGRLFSFLTEMDIYALFGNVLENAIEAAERAPSERRFISLKAARRGGMAVLLVENSYANELSYDDGELPATNKPEAHHHGFGLRSVRDLAERNGGGISIQAEEGVFRLTVTLRAPEGERGARASEEAGVRP